MAHVDTSTFAVKANLVSLKTEADQLDTDKLKLIPKDLAKLSNVAKNDIAKKSEYNALKIKVDNIDTDDYVLKNKYHSEI